MGWFCNFYKCADCGNKWADVWSATCDDDCPHCGARHMSPYKSTDAARPRDRMATETTQIPLEDGATDEPAVVFQNYYRCERCDGKWTDVWSAMCDDDCPHCGARHMSPFKSVELSDAAG